MRPTDYPSIKIYRVATLKLNVLLGSMLMGGAMPVYALLFGEDPARPEHREAVIAPLQTYFEQGLEEGVPATAMTRHWHGLFHGQPGAVAWRRAMAEGRSPATAVA